MSLQSQSIPTFGILSFSDIEKVKDKFEIEYHKSGDILLKPGEVSKKLYFIFKGLVSCSSVEGNIIWFEFEKNIAAEIVSFVSQEPSENYLKVAEDDTVLISITYDNINQLFCDYHHWALWGNMLTQQALLRLTEYYRKLHIKDATDRYNELITYVPNLLERVSLKDIASCLGISPVSLSRIRASYKHK